jgi:RecB family endonuclease NucS
VILLDRNDRTVVVECKQGPPSAAAIDQLRRYLAYLKKEKGITARGILVHGGSKKLHAEVVEAADANPRIEVVQHRLAVGFARCN